MTETTAHTAAKLATLVDLKPGDRIWHSGQVREVRHVEPYTSPAGKVRCLVVFAAGITLDDFAHAQFPLATAEEIADATAYDRRQALVAALSTLAKGIIGDALPVPRFRMTLGGVVATRADVERWAEWLGVEIRMGGDGNTIPVAERDVPAGDLTLEIHFQGPAESAS